MPSLNLPKFPGLDREAVQNAMTFSTSALAKAAEHSQLNVAAATASVTALTEGVRAAYSQSATYSKSAVSSHLAALKALTAARSIQDVVELQTAHTKASIEQFVAQIGKMAETYSTSVRGTVQPLQDRVTSALKASEPSAS